MIVSPVLHVISLQENAETYLGSTKKSIAMAQSNRLCRGGNCQVSNVHARLTTSNNQDLLVNTKLISLLELRRVDNSGSIVKSFDDWDVGNDMQAGADGNSIASILLGLAILGVFDNMSTLTTRIDLCHSCREINVGQELELLGIAFEVGAVLGCKEEVWRLWGIAIVGEGCQLTRRDKL
jgi:hypothetical protein